MLRTLTRALCATLALSALVPVASAQAPTPAPVYKFTELAQTPPMGWNTWNTFASNISEKLVLETADAMIANGMRDAGYIYIVLDDTWSTRERDPQGNLVADPVKFPRGMKALVDELHAKGFKFGIYNCAGTETCAGYPGGRGHEFQDALIYASWGVDYLKYDWCNTGTANAQETYKTMSAALRKAGRPVVFSLCEWGTAKPWEWAGNIGHLWRTTGDIYDSYNGEKGWEMGWKRILDLQHKNEVHKYSGPGRWNDPDMLEVGNEGLTFAESRAHFSFWCMLAAPLMAGNDVRHMSPEIRAVLTDREAIAIDQDPLGKQATRILSDEFNGIEIWARELANGDYAFCALNTSHSTKPLTIEWHRFHHVLKGRFLVRNVWTKAAAGDTDTSLTATVDSHDVLFLRLTPAK